VPNTASSTQIHVIERIESSKGNIEGVSAGRRRV